MLLTRPALLRAARVPPRLTRASLRASAVRAQAAAAVDGTGAGSNSGLILRSIASNGECAVLVADCTALVAHAQRLHDTSPTATAALGRAMVGSLLLSVFKGEGETVQLSWSGDGPLGKVLVVADSSGFVKGMVSNRLANPPLRADRKLNVGAAVGEGVLSVVRSHPDWKEPYTGMVPITTGEIAEDIATYLNQSEQVASAIGLGVLIDRDLNVEQAGGFLVQVLPFASEETLSALERNIAALPSMTTMLSSGLTTTAITEKILASIGVSPGAQEVTAQYGPCDEAEIRKRMERACVSLGPAELRRIIEKEEKLEVRCELCCISLQLDTNAVLEKATATV